MRSAARRSGTPGRSSRGRTGSGRCSSSRTASARGRSSTSIETDEPLALIIPMGLGTARPRAVSSLLARERGLWPHEEGRQMSRVSHQTIKLSPGKHYSPDDGACVMELASMLAGEPFNDHPASVCPVLGSLLRSYNDSVDDDVRQDLYLYAARVVGTRADADVERRRSEYVVAWTY